MDQALNTELLERALGEVSNLLSPDELRQMLAAAEVAAFFALDEPLDASVIRTAWLLHQVGTVRPGLGSYSTERQVQANSVAAHILDLVLQDRDLSEGERLIMTFAAQVSSIRGDRAPNASALGRRLPHADMDLLGDPGRTSLILGTSLLTLDRARTLVLLRSAERQGASLAGSDEWGTYASAVGVIRGTRQLLRYLADGATTDLGAAKASFEAAATDTRSARDLDSRWVAADLLDLAEDFGSSSVWAILPDGTPPAVGRAMTLGDPPVLTLWPPQVELLSSTTDSPLLSGSQRSVLTFPTSAGKTLMAQLAVHHLATASSSVCVVAPSHSLCREIRKGLERRTWALRKTIAEDGPLGDPRMVQASVVVMTPERLASRLRNEETELLAEFGLFILDEAHLVGDLSRGWTFETTISRLHQLTADTDHRIVLISAALGGTTSVRSWVGASETGGTVKRWRGPRRLHATWTPTEDRSSSRKVPPQGRQKYPRQFTDYNGIVRLYVDGGQAVAARQRNIGEIEQYGGTTKLPPVAKRLKPIVEFAERAGPVLTVHARKTTAEALAKELAQGRESRPATRALSQMAAQRLGPSHPLVDVLAVGVAYHHAALPVDVQSEIEDACRSGLITVVCATTTLTEGINLPVRTVVICERGFRTEEGFQTVLSPSGVINAAGRAGRAGRETEGWVVIADQSGAPSPRDALCQMEEDQDVLSTLSSPDGLAALDEYERLLDETGALVLQDVPSEVDGFLAYCWYLAEASQASIVNSRISDVVDGIKASLAWQQLSDDRKARWERLAVLATKGFEATDPELRRRWARTGAGLSSNAVLEGVADTLRADLVGLDPLLVSDPLAVLDLLISNGRLASLLDLVPERDRRFKARRYGEADPIEVDLSALVTDWVSGKELLELAETHLGEVEDDGFRFEQLSAFLARVCEHHLPWMASVLLEWINGEQHIELCPVLPAHLHYGVDSAQALHLLRSGVRSRRLAVLVGEQAAADGVETRDLRRWLAGLGPLGWQERFQSWPSEVADLLLFVRDRGAELSAALLDGGTLDVTADLFDEGLASGTDLRLELQSGAGRPQTVIALTTDGVAVGAVKVEHFHDLAVLLECGFRVHATVERRHVRQAPVLAATLSPD